MSSSLHKTLKSSRIALSSRLATTWISAPVWTGESYEDPYYVAIPSRRDDIKDYGGLPECHGVDSGTEPWSCNHESPTGPRGPTLLAYRQNLGLTGLVTGVSIVQVVRGLLETQHSDM